MLWLVHARSAVRAHFASAGAVADVHVQKRLFARWKSTARRSRRLKRVEADARGLLDARRLRRALVQWLTAYGRARAAAQRERVLTAQAVGWSDRALLAQSWAQWRHSRMDRFGLRMRVLHALRVWRSAAAAGKARAAARAKTDGAADALRARHMWRATLRAWAAALVQRRVDRRVFAECDARAERLSVLRALKRWRTFAGRRHRLRVRDTRVAARITGTVRQYATAPMPCALPRRISLSPSL